MKQLLMKVAGRQAGVPDILLELFPEVHRAAEPDVGRTSGQRTGNMTSYPTVYDASAGTLTIG